MLLMSRKLTQAILVGVALMFVAGTGQNDPAPVDPAVWHNAPGVPALPGNKPTRGIPGAVIVDKNGNTIFSGYGAAVLEWKKYTIDRK